MGPPGAKARLYGRRVDRTFRAAATKFLEENQHKRSIDDDAMHLRLLDPFVGDRFLRHVHLGTLEEFIANRRADGVKTKSLNAALPVVRRIVNLAATEWIEEQGLTWLDAAPRIRLFPVTDARSPSVFLIPGERVKNGEERLVVLNRVARSVIESCRGMHPTFVFVRECRRHAPRPVTGMNNTAWKSPRERAAVLWADRFGESASDGFRRIRVHGLKHTFGRRLRAAGVSFEDPQDLLGHKSACRTLARPERLLGAGAPRPSLARGTASARES